MMFKISLSDNFFSAQESPDLCRLIGNGHFHRLKNLLESTRGNVVIRGDLDEVRKSYYLSLLTVNLTSFDIL
jgi:beta-apo-4'-carotenal oxygenase